MELNIHRFNFLKQKYEVGVAEGGLRARQGRGDWATSPTRSATCRTPWTRSASSVTGWTARSRLLGADLDPRVPTGDPLTAWERRCAEYRLVNPANRRKLTVIVVDTRLAQ